MSTILDKIVAYKRVEIVQAKQTVATEKLEQQLESAPPVRDFVAALSAAQPMALIAEVKKASPSAGLICEKFDPVEIAESYEQSGAACISCLTDEHFFQGRLDYLSAIRQSVSIPVLRKDFLLDRYQVLQARIAGADCILLIAECLDDPTLGDLYAYASQLGMSCLIECYEPNNLERVVKLKPTLVGINNRNLKTFQTDLEHSISLAQCIDHQCLLVSESGVSCREDVLQLQDAGIGAILVGETLMRAPDTQTKIRELLDN